jgi:predicted GIY-YIG superfamily endonuclease
MYHCYLIQSDANKNFSYIGITRDLERRIRQHNGQLTGGAKCTRRFNDWVYVTSVECQTHSDAARFEWYWKHYQTKNGRWRRTKSGIEQKIKRLQEVKESLGVNLVIANT